MARPVCCCATTCIRSSQPKPRSKPLPRAGARARGSLTIDRSVELDDCRRREAFTELPRCEHLAGKLLHHPVPHAGLEVGAEEVGAGGPRRVVGLAEQLEVLGEPSIG